MTRKSKRILSVLCLVATILSISLIPTAGYGETLRFVFLADSQSGSMSDPINTPVVSAIVDRILELSPLPWAVFFGGDQTTILDAQLFKSAMKPLTDAGIKLYTALGNHELFTQESASGGQFFLASQTAYQQAFTDNPSNGPAGYEHLVYSVSSPGGDAFFAVLDPYYLTADVTSPNASGNITDAQLTWLGDQLAKTKATHKFLFIHTPFSYVTQPEGTMRGSFTKLWAILNDNKFDIYFCGHSHLYSRKAIDGNTTLYPPRHTPKWKNKVVQLICGTCGAPPQTEGVVVDANEWHVSNSNDTYYLSVVDIDGSTTKVNSYSGYTSASGYKLFDSFAIKKGSTDGIELLLE